MQHISGAISGPASLAAHCNRLKINFACSQPLPPAALPRRGSREGRAPLWMLGTLSLLRCRGSSSRKSIRSEHPCMLATSGRAQDSFGMPFCTQRSEHLYELS